MRSVRVIGIAVLFGLAACSGRKLAADAGVAPDGSVALDGGVAADTGTPTVFGCTPISDSAKAGCRASDEPGCAKCCLQTTPDRCDMWSTPCSRVIGGQQVGEYCSAESLPGQCPSGCLACASCSKSSEAALCSLMPTIGACDCANLVIGIDPCISPQSCGCLCRGYLAALAACPAVGPAPEKRCGDNPETRFSAYNLEQLQQYSDCTVLVGYFQNDSVTELKDFAPLSHVRRIEGTLNVFRSPGFVTLHGLENLEEVQGNLYIHLNPNLTSIAALAKLRTVTGNLMIVGNDVLPQTEVESIAAGITVGGTKTLMQSTAP